MKSGNTPANTYILSSVNNALKILDLLSVRDNIGATEIGRLLELDKSTVFKLLYTLEQRDYVLKTESAKYCLGYKFKNYGNIVSERQNLVDVAKPFMHALYEQLHETVCLAELNTNGKAIVTALMEGDTPKHVKSRVGYEMGSYDNANGKLLLANLSDHMQHEILSRIHLAPRTPHTIVSRDVLEKELKNLRGRLWVEQYEEYRLNHADIACPVFDMNGHVAAALSVACTPDYLRENHQLIADALLHASTLISRKLGFYGKPFAMIDGIPDTP